MPVSPPQYRPRHGEPAYRSAISRLLLREYATTAPPDAVLATHGVSGGIVAGLAWAGDRARAAGRRCRIALIEPFYTYHILQVERILGPDAEKAFIPLAGDAFDVDWAAVERTLAADGGAAALIVCNPSNPSGRVWTRDEMRHLVRADAGCPAARLMTMMVPAWH